jgi:hypothetical protein
MFWKFSGVGPVPQTSTEYVGIVGTEGFEPSTLGSTHREPVSGSFCRRGLHLALSLSYVPWSATFSCLLPDRLTAGARSPSRPIRPVVESVRFELTASHLQSGRSTADTTTPMGFYLKRSRPLYVSQVAFRPSVRTGNLSLRSSNGQVGARIRTSKSLPDKGKRLPKLGYSDMKTGRPSPKFPKR